MSAVELASWLGELGLSRYVEAFAARGLDGPALPALTDRDLKDMGVRSLGHRKKLLAAIARLPGAARPAEPTQAAEPVAERRTVTVLMCDIAGFTRLTGDHDPEEVHALLNEFFKLVDSAVRLYGGHVDKHIGDAVLAVFGAPVAHTNDPERAARAAFDIQREVAALSRPLEVHIGIASGSVVASSTGGRDRGEYTVTGRAVILAGELQNLASPGQIVASESVHRHVAPWVEATAMDQVMLKGMDEPVTPWRLERLRTSAAMGARTELAGRRAELARFGELLDQLCQREKGAILHVRGETGIGKTRLIQEFCALAEARGVACHTGLVLDFGDGTGQSAVADIACSLLGVRRQSSVEDRARAAEHALQSGLVARNRDVYLHDLLDLAPSAAQRVRYHAMNHAARGQGKHQTLVELVTACAKQTPLLLMIEDVHWADAEVMGHIEHLGRAVAGLAALLVVTSRNHADPLTRLDPAAPLPFIVMDLGPLPPEDALALAGRVIEADARDAQIYVDRAGGNPLFLEQLLHSAGETALDTVPDSIQSIVQARIDNLSPADRRALQSASVMGQRFSQAALRHLLDDPDYRCDTLIAHHLIQPVAEREYLFAHELVLEAVYSSLLGARRRQLHARAAEWFASRDPVLHAEHLERADDPLAIRAYLDAAGALCGEYRFERAQWTCERALDLVERDSSPLAGDAAGRDAARYEILCALGDVKHRLGDARGSILAFEQAENLARQEEDRCRVWLGLAQGMRIVDRNDEALLMLDRAERVAARRQLVAELAAIHCLRGNLLFPRGDLEGCLKQHTLARDYAQRAGSAELEARALSGLGDAAYMRAHMLTAHIHFDRCIELCRAHGLAGIEVANLPMRGLTRFFQLKVQDALRDAQDAAAQAVLIGDRRAEILARGGSMGAILLEMGRLDEARRELEASIELARSVGARRFEPLALMYLGKLLAEQGQRDKAQAMLEYALAVSRETGFSFIGTAVLGALALVTDDPDVRARALNHGERALAGKMPGHNRLRFHRDAIDAGLRAGDAALVERQARALEDFIRAEPAPWASFVIARGRALAAHLRGARDHAHMETLRALHDQATSAGLTPAARSLADALGDDGDGDGDGGGDGESS